MTIMQHDFDANGFCQNDTTHYQPAEDSDGDGTYEISNAGQLYWFADKVNNGEYSLNAVLTADISVNEAMSPAVTATRQKAGEIGHPLEMLAT